VRPVNACQAYQDSWTVQQTLTQNCCDFFPFFCQDLHVYGPCFITVPDHLEEVGSKSPAVLQAGFKLNAILSLLYYQLQKQFLNLKFHQCHLQPLGTRRTFGHSWSDNPLSVLVMISDSSFLNVEIYNNLFP